MGSYEIIEDVPTVNVRIWGSVGMVELDVTELVLAVLSSDDSAGVSLMLSSREVGCVSHFEASEMTRTPAPGAAGQSGRPPTLRVAYNSAITCEGSGEQYALYEGACVLGHHKRAHAMRVTPSADGYMKRPQNMRTRSWRGRYEELAVSRRLADNDKAAVIVFNSLPQADPEQITAVELHLYKTRDESGHRCSNTYRASAMHVEASDRRFQSGVYADPPVSQDFKLGRRGGWHVIDITELAMQMKAQSGGDLSALSVMLTSTERACRSVFASVEASSGELAPVLMMKTSMCELGYVEDEEAGVCVWEGCGEGAYADMLSLGVCRECTACGHDEYRVMECSNTADGVCLSCEQRSEWECGPGAYLEGCGFGSEVAIPTPYTLSAVLS